MSVQETSQAIAALTQLEVQLLADKIVEEISGLGKKSISKRRIIEMVAGELQKMGVLSSRGDGSLDGADRQSCNPVP